MKVILVTYADQKMKRSQLLCGQSAMKHGVDVVWANNPDTIDKKFVEFNKEIFAAERGAGYWLWKPWVVYNSLLQAQEGDMLIYADAGIEFVNNVRYIIDRMDEDIFFFSNGHVHFEWCKGDCWQSILHDKIEKRAFDCFIEKESLRDLKQVQASVIFFKVNEATKAFAKEWLMWCQMPGFIEDSPSKLPNYPTFAEHRHDQAILTCLQIKHGYKLHHWPTAYAEHIRIPGDDYPVLFNHHRKRNHGFGNGDSEWDS